MAIRPGVADDGVRFFVISERVDPLTRHRHAEFLQQSGGYCVRDVGSLNGTYLNRERIEDEAPLANGDEVQIGKFKLVFLSTSTG